MDNNVLRGWAKRRLSRKIFRGKCKGKILSNFTFPKDFIKQDIKSINYKRNKLNTLGFITSKLYLKGTISCEKKRSEKQRRKGKI